MSAVATADPLIPDLLGTASTPAVVPLTGTLGAEVSGVDLAAGPSDASAAWIRAALVEHKVLFFRGQHLTATQQVAFAATFGVLTPAHPLAGGLDEDHPEVLVLDSSAYPLGLGRRTSTTSYNDRWHTDVTFAERPPTASVLCAEIIPPTGGDTLWADLEDAYATLSPKLQRILDETEAVHTAAGSVRVPRARGHRPGPGRRRLHRRRSPPGGACPSRERPSLAVRQRRVHRRPRRVLRAGERRVC